MRRRPFFAKACCEGWRNDDPPGSGLLGFAGAPTEIGQEQATHGGVVVTRISRELVQGFSTPAVGLPARLEVAITQAQQRRWGSAAAVLDPGIITIPQKQQLVS